MAYGPSPPTSPVHVRRKRADSPPSPSSASAGAKFASLVLRAVVSGESGLVSPSYVALSADAAGGKKVVEEIGGKDLEFFSVNVELGVRTPSPPPLPLRLPLLACRCMPFADKPASCSTLSQTASPRSSRSARSRRLRRR